MIRVARPMLPPAPQALIRMNAHVERGVRASPDRVFDALVDPGVIRRWFGPGLGTVLHVDVDPCVGGTFSIVQRRGDLDFDTRGRYRELARPSRLAFTWSTFTDVPEDPEGYVTIEISARGPGALVMVTHTLAPSWAGRTAEAEAGWAEMLEALSAAL